MKYEVCSKVYAFHNRKHMIGKVEKKFFESRVSRGMKTTEWIATSISIFILALT